MNSGTIILWRVAVIEKHEKEGCLSSVSFEFLLKSEHQSACCLSGS